MRRLFTAVVILVLVSVALRAAEETPAVDRLAQIREGYEATLEALHDISVSSSREYIKLPWIPPIVKLSPRYVPQHPGPYFYTFVRSGDRYGWWYYGREFNWTARHPIDWTVTDGLLSLHVTDEKDNPNATEKGRGIRIGRKVDIDVAAGSALFFMGWYNGATPIEAFESEKVTVKEEPVVIGEIETWVVSAPFKHFRMKYWFAPERSFLPLKVEMWRDVGIADRREFSEHETLPGGVYFPRRVLETHYDVEKGEIAFQTTWKVLDVKVGGKVPDETFSTSLERIPEGFTVQDDSVPKLEKKAPSEEKETRPPDVVEPAAETAPSGD